MLQKVRTWFIGNYTACMISGFVLALFITQVAKFYFDSSFHEVVTNAIGLRGGFSAITAIYIALVFALILALYGFFRLNQRINTERRAKTTKLNS